MFSINAQASWPLLFVLLVGCGVDGRPAVAPVSGVVTYQGRPVEAAVVTFLPAASRPAVGRTDHAGKFHLTTFEPDDGAVPGEHQVTIAKMTPDLKDATPYPKQISLIPPKYSEIGVSSLRAAVKLGEANDFSFELKD